MYYATPTGNSATPKIDMVEHTHVGRGPNMKLPNQLTFELLDHLVMILQGPLQDSLGVIHFPPPLCTHRVRVVPVGTTEFLMREWSRGVWEWSRGVGVVMGCGHGSGQGVWEWVIAAPVYMHY